MTSHQQFPSAPVDDLGADALAALSFAEREPSPVPPPIPSKSQDDSSSKAVPPPTQYRSSFGPSKAALKRKEEREAQQAAHHAAALKPGRPNGKAKKKPRAGGGAWDTSEEEDDEEPEEEDDDDDEFGGKHSFNGPSSRSSPAIHAPQPIQRNAIQQAAHSMNEMGARMGPSPDSTRPVRMLPQPPTGRSPVHDGQHRLSNEHDPSRQPHLAQAPNRSIWTSVLDPGNNTNPTANSRNTFVSLDDEDNKMTKAFTQTGLLQAGMQDKQDRSAKRQEELARETGSSLVNVPTKPPPPQTGLLGAITAHERERSREGGFGAALTERERDRRVAEERQRKLDELQRNQLEMAQNGTGSVYDMYGGGGQMGNPMMSPMMNPMMNPMMMMNPMNPMMMNPMMTGYGWNPQIMAAQQAAAEAYRSAMASFSVAGSVVGGEGGEGGQPGSMQGMGMPPMMGPWGMAPMMTGMSGMSPMGMGMNPMGMSMGSMGMSPMNTGAYGSPQGGFGGGMPDHARLSSYQGTPIATPIQSLGEGLPGQRKSGANSPAPQSKPPS
jgi:CCR4-NOT transcriptional complex subunit CAF120